MATITVDNVDQMTEEAQAALAAHGIDPVAYVTHFSVVDACGCVDDRCIGFHHEGTGDCGCLEPCIEMYLEATSTSTHEPGVNEPAKGAVLLAAQLELERQLQQCEQWQERVVLAHLATIADHTRRVAEVTSRGYRAEKTSVILEAAVALQRDTLIDLGGWSETDQPTGTEAAVTELFSLIEVVAGTAVQAGFTLAGGDEVSRDTSKALAEAADALGTWARRAPHRGQV